MSFNPFSGSDWQHLGGTIGGGFSDFGGLVGGSFAQGFQFVLDTGSTIEGQVGSGALIVIKSASGTVNYAVDYTKVTAASTQDWVTTAAGDVTDFSVDAYNEAKKLGEAVWKLLSNPVNPPLLGPPNPIARDCMKYMFSSPAVSMWERDAVSKHYTMAFDFRMTAALPPIAQTAFSGIYVDSTGQWGFFAQTGTGISPSFNANLDVELWMGFGDRNDFQQPCYMPGLSVSVTLPSGLTITGGLNILVRPSGSFKGFRFRAGLALLPSQLSVAPDAGPPQTTLTCYALSDKAPSYSAASAVTRGASQEPTVLATAMLSTMPFVRKPGSWFFIRCKGSNRYMEVRGGSGDDVVQIEQASFSGAAAQRFRFADQGDGSFLIFTALGNGNKVLDIQGASTDDGASLIQYERSGNDNQRFQIGSSDDGWFSITPRHSGKALAINGGSQLEGSDFVQWPWGGADNFKFQFIEVKAQEQWRWCHKCQLLWFSGAASSCPAGGAHDSTGSGPYVLISVGAESYGAIVQDKWRWCCKCSCLFYGGDVNSKCPRDGGYHDPTGSGNYAAANGGPPDALVQEGWRWCNKCQGLWYAGANQGACAAGGGHDGTGSGNYRVLHT